MRLPSNYLKTRFEWYCIEYLFDCKSHLFPPNLLVEKIDPYGIGIRFGDFYAKKIIQDLDLTKKDGVVRVSLVHYNTLEEVNALINAFEKVLP